MRALALLAAALALLALIAPTAGQAGLVGPLLAVDTAEQDRILLYDMATLAPRELRFGPGMHRIWGFSADGCRVGFTLGEPSRVYDARLDGGDVRELVQYADLPPADWSAWNPQWSPDGARIAFTFIRDEMPMGTTTARRSYHIAQVPADGGAPELYSASGDEHEPAWSPDGRWLAYIAFEERIAGADIQSTAVPTPVPAPGQAAPALPTVREADLWAGSADGTSRYRLTSFDTGSVRAPRWSPDGALIGFIYSPSPGNDQFWMIANQPDAIPTQLSYRWSLVLDHTWLPDGSAMLASVRDFGDVRENRLWQIPLIPPADDAATPYIDDPGLRFADYPRFDPAGSWLAFRSAYALALVDLSTMGWWLFEDVLGNTPAVWSPPGFAGEAAC